MQMEQPTIGTQKNTTRRDILVLVLLCLVVFVPSIPLRDLWTPDEPRYMEVAREMVVMHDYVVPHLNGEIYGEKPPVFFWLAAGFHHLGFGVNSGRIVAGLAALGTALATYFAARGRLPGVAPLLSAVTLLTLYLFHDAKSGLIDPLLMFWAAAYMFCGFVALQPETHRRFLAWIWFYLFLAAAVLTKGHPALVPLLALAVYAAVQFRSVRIRSWAHLVGIVLFFALIAAWLAPMLIQAGPVYRELLYRQLISRTTGSYESHVAPFYYYAALSPLLFLPWIFVLPVAGISAIVEWARRSLPPLARLAVIWAAVTFLVFSWVPGKRVGYLMPLLPAAALLIGWFISAARADGFRWPRWTTVLFRITFGLFFVIAVGIVVGLTQIHTLLDKLLPMFADDPAAISAKVQGLLTPGLQVGLAIAAAVMGLAALVGFRFSGRGRNPLITFAAVAAIMFAYSLTWDLVLVPKVNAVKSPRVFCSAVLPYLKQADEVHLFGKDLSGVYNLYTGVTAMPVVGNTDTDDAAKDKKAAKEQAAIAARAEVEPLLRSGRKVAIIARQDGWVKVMGENRTDCSVVVAEPVSSRVMVLIVNWKDTSPTSTGK